MVTVEELKESFVTREVKPYGTCICIPNKDFKPEWEKELQSQGYKIFLTMLENSPFVLVQLKKLESQPETKRDWTPEEEQRLLQRMQELPGTIEEKCLKLTQEFTERTPTAIRLKYAKLKQLSERQKTTKYTKTPSTTETPTTPQLTLEQLTDLLKQIRNFLKPKSFSFDYACQHCNNIGCVDDAKNIWRFCPNCGKPLTVYNVKEVESVE
jgi:ribosomal protein S27E